jgi:CP family cyanate transporter-like MFS transporter
MNVVPERATRETTTPAGRPGLVMLALVLLAVNLRTTVASVPPLLGAIERDLGLSGPAAGLLTALPVLCMALFAPLAHRLAHRFGRGATTAAAIVLVALGNGLRLAGGMVAVLFGSTLIAGLGVAICGVVLPGLIKELFPGRVGAMTGAYSVAMMLGAAGAAAASVPLEHRLGSWQAALAAWAIPAALAAVAWLVVIMRVKATERVSATEPGEETHPGGLPWRSRSAWLLGAFFSLQAALAYAVLGWLAPAYEARGWSPAAAGGLLAVNNLAQLATALVLPALSDRLSERRPVLLAAGLATVFGCAWLLVLPDKLPWLASTVVGLGLGGGFTLALVLMADYAAHPAASSRLAAMVFLVGYTTAAVAPVAVGALRDATGGFRAPFALLTIMAVMQAAFGTRLGPERRATVA